MGIVSVPASSRISEQAFKLCDPDWCREMITLGLKQRMDGRSACCVCSQFTPLLLRNDRLIAPPVFLPTTKDRVAQQERIAISIMAKEHGKVLLAA